MEVFFSSTFAVIFHFMKSLAFTLIILISAPLMFTILGVLVLSGRSIDEVRKQVTRAQQEAENKAIESENEFMEYVNKEVDTEKRSSPREDEDESKANGIVV